MQIPLRRVLPSNLGRRALSQDLRQAQSAASSLNGASDLFKNVLIVRKTPRYFRLKDTEYINHPYIRDVLLGGWIDATQTHFDICEKFEQVARPFCDQLTVVQEWPLRPKDTRDKSLIISLGGDGTFLRTSSMIESCDTPLVGINTDPGRSLGILCSKFLYKDRTQPAHIEKIFVQLAK